MSTVGVLTYPLIEWNLIHINELLRRVQEQVKIIEGTRGEWERSRLRFGDNYFRYVDANGQILHGFGDVV